MKSIGSPFIRGLGAAVTLAVVAFCPLNAQAEVVYGELGSAVVASIDTSATDSASHEDVKVNWLAHGFAAGMPSQSAVGAVTPGVADTDSGTIPLSAAIFASEDASPTLPVDASDVTNVEAIEKFMNNHASVDPNAVYSLVLSSGSWQISAGLRLTPTDRSDFGRLSARAAASPAPTIPRGPWSNAAGEDSASASDAEGLSMEAVPEPSSAIVAGFGILGVAVMHRRRRRS
jgi:hypothetical protein